METKVIDFLIGLPLFDELSGSELKIVERHFNYLEYAPGETIFKEGDKGDHVCFVASGTVDIVKTSKAGETVVIAMLSKSRSIGEMSIIDKAPRSATAIARTHVKMVTMTDRGFHQLQETFPRIGIKILMGLARLLSMNLRKASARLMDYMLPMG